MNLSRIRWSHIWQPDTHVWGQELRVYGSRFFSRNEFREQACRFKPNSTTSEMRKISLENTLVQKFSLLMNSTVEKKFAKTQAFDWFRYSVIQNTSIWLASLFPFRNGVETNSTTRRREIFRRETFQIYFAHAFDLFTRNFSHFARRGIRP
jgi:hypothetical protein